MKTALPGEELIAQGIRDMARGAETVESLLISICAPRLLVLGIVVPAPVPNAEERLYRLLATQHGDGAHARYNALIRRVVSFERAAACAS